MFGGSLAWVKNMKVHADTRPFWIDSTPLPRYPKLERDESVDVLVIGAGITGLTAAYLLTLAGRRVAVIERERCAQIDTGHTSAHLTMVTDVKMTELVKNFGRGQRPHDPLKRHRGCDEHTAGGQRRTARRDAVSDQARALHELRRCRAREARARAGRVVLGHRRSVPLSSARAGPRRGRRHLRRTGPQDRAGGRQQPLLRTARTHARNDGPRRPHHASLVGTGG